MSLSAYIPVVILDPRPHLLLSQVRQVLQGVL